MSKMPQYSKFFKNDFTKSQLSPELQRIKNRGLSQSHFLVFTNKMNYLIIVFDTLYLHCKKSHPTNSVSLTRGLLVKKFKNVLNKYRPLSGGSNSAHSTAVKKLTKLFKLISKRCSSYLHIKVEMDTSSYLLGR